MGGDGKGKRRRPANRGDVGRQPNRLASGSETRGDSGDRSKLRSRIDPTDVHSTRVGNWGPITGWKIDDRALRASPPTGEKTVRAYGTGNWQKPAPILIVPKLDILFPLIAVFPIEHALDFLIILLDERFQFSNASAQR